MSPKRKITPEQAGRQLRFLQSKNLRLHRMPTSGSAAARHSFAAWIDAVEAPADLARPRTATPRVRAGLVLRRVGRKKSVEGKSSHDSCSR